MNSEIEIQGRGEVAVIKFQFPESDFQHSTLCAGASTLEPQRWSLNFCIFLIALLAALFIPASGQEILQTRKIWDQAPHNAFTDLVRYRGSFYCTFRESAAHVPKGRAENGKIRILKSKDGKSWKSAALLESEQYDFRDPKVSVTADHKLLVLMGGSDYTTGKLGGCLTHVSFSNDGKEFTNPKPVSIEVGIRTDFDWIWRLDWHNGTGYGVVYQCNQPDGQITVRMLSTRDGINYQQVCNLGLTGIPNEATTRFEDDRMYMVIRREGPGANGLLGSSDPPYTNWTWTDLGMKIGGPEFAFSGKGRIAMGTRLYRSSAEGGVKTGVVFMDTNGKIERILDLPSGGDTSYPGMVLHKGKLYVSYYSSHEGKTSIYLSTIQL
ncbi:MAG TPA: hypothetical protein DC042_16130 [Bacteroidales bacterium]|nr:hypothetical protein [Bacteroidales bacterium]